MIKLGENVYANFQLQNTSKDSQHQVKVLLLGNCGVGKSRFTNNLCSSTQEVGIAKSSITTYLYRGSCQYEELLSIYDSPGIDSRDEISEKQLSDALIQNRWNVVGVFSKLDPRYGDKTLQDLVRISKVFDASNKMLVFLVSNLDIVSDGQKDKMLSDFSECLRQYGITEKIILFSNEDSDFRIVSKALYYECASTQPKKLSIKKKKIKQFFNAIQIIDQLDSVTVYQERKNNTQQIQIGLQDQQKKPEYKQDEKIQQNQMQKSSNDNLIDNWEQKLKIQKQVITKTKTIHHNSNSTNKSKKSGKQERKQKQININKKTKRKRKFDKVTITKQKHALNINPQLQDYKQNSNQITKNIQKFNSFSLRDLIKKVSNLLNIKVCCFIVMLGLFLLMLSFLPNDNLQTKNLKSGYYTQNYQHLRDKHMQVNYRNDGQEVIVKIQDNQQK